MFVSIKNMLPGLLDLAPLKDSTGHPLVLRGNASKEIAQEDVGHPVIQRVKAAGWVKIGGAAEPEVLPPPPAPPAPPPVIKTEAPQEELVMPNVPDEPSAPVAATPPASTESEAPVEPVPAESAPVEPTPTKSSKSSRKS